MNLHGRSFLTLKDYSKEEIRYLLDLAHKLKADKKKGILGNRLAGKNIVLLFEKTSTRTRCAFEVAALDEGGHVTFLSNSQMGKKESIEDTAKVLGRFYDGIEFRGFAQSDVDALVKYSGVPVWNGLTDAEHPTQIIADYMTMKEKLGDLKGKKVVFVGDYKNNMGYSVMIGAAFTGMDVVLCGPKKYKDQMDKKIIEKCQKLFKENGGSLEFSDDKIKAAKNADVIYTDVWVSLGEPFELFDKRIGELKDFQVDMKMMKAAKDSVIFMHCLPAFHDDHTSFSKEVAQTLGKKYPIVKKGEIEVTDEVFQSLYNKAFDQAENRMHSIKAIILATIGY